MSRPPDQFSVQKSVLATHGTAILASRVTAMSRIYRNLTGLQPRPTRPEPEGGDGGPLDEIPA